MYDYDSKIHYKIKNNFIVKKCQKLKTKFDDFMK